MASSRATIKGPPLVRRLRGVMATGKVEESKVWAEDQSVYRQQFRYLDLPADTTRSTIAVAFSSDGYESYICLPSCVDVYPFVCCLSERSCASVFAVRFLLSFGCVQSQITMVLVLYCTEGPKGRRVSNGYTYVVPQADGTGSTIPYSDPVSHHHDRVILLSVPCQCSLRLWSWTGGSSCHSM